MEVVDPSLELGDEAESKQFPSRVVVSLPEEFQVLALRVGSTWLEVTDGVEPSAEQLRAAARAVLTDEMNATMTVTVAPMGTGHIEHGPLWRPMADGAAGTPLLLFALGTGTAASFKQFEQPTGSSGGTDPIEKAVLRVSIAVSRA